MTVNMRFISTQVINHSQVSNHGCNTFEMCGLVSLCTYGVHTCQELSVYSKHLFLEYDFRITTEGFMSMTASDWLHSLIRVEATHFS